MDENKPAYRPDFTNTVPEYLQVDTNGRLLGVAELTARLEAVERRVAELEAFRQSLMGDLSQPSRTPASMLRLSGTAADCPSSPRIVLGPKQYAQMKADGSLEELFGAQTPEKPE
jgi:hypothetical protein